MSHKSHDKTIKNIGVICLSVIIFALIYNVLLGGNGFNAHMAYGRASGYGLGSSLNVILALVIKLLFVVIIAAVVAGIVAAFKNQDLDNINFSFIDKLFDNGHHRRHLCPHCHREIEHEWKHCPYCGSSTKKEHKTHKHANKLESNVDAAPAENDDRQVKGRQTKEVEQSTNDVGSTKSGNSKKTKTEPKKNGKTKR